MPEQAFSPPSHETSSSQSEHFSHGLRNKNAVVLTTKSKANTAVESIRQQLIATFAGNDSPGNLPAKS